MIHCFFSVSTRGRTHFMNQSSLPQEIQYQPIPSGRTMLHDFPRTSAITKKGRPFQPPVIENMNKNDYSHFSSNYDFPSIVQEESTDITSPTCSALVNLAQTIAIIQSRLFPPWKLQSTTKNYPNQSMHCTRSALCDNKPYPNKGREL